MKKSKGFTLLELMITVAIVAVFSTMAFPSFMQMIKKARLKKAGRDMVTNFQRARIGALKEGRSWNIIFDKDAQKYTVFDSGDDGKLETDDDIAITSVNLSEYKGVEFGVVKQLEDYTIPTDGISFDNNKVTFKANGNSTPGTVYFKNSENEGFAVGINNKAGKIKSWAHWNSTGKWES